MSEYGKLEESYVINIPGRYIIHYTNVLEDNKFDTYRIYLIDNYGSSYSISWGNHNGIISNRERSFDYYKNKPFIEYLYGTGGNIKLSNESIDLVKLKKYPNNNDELVKELLLINK